MVRASSKTLPVRSSLRLYLLGSFRVELNAQTIRFSTHKIELLLAYLALHPQPHTREKLAALFWGDSTDEHARQSLRNALATLRKTLGDELLLTDRETIKLNPYTLLWVDACQLEQIMMNDPPSAVALYKGDLLSDFYDDWVLPERERLRTLYIDTLLRVTQDARSQSQYRRAIEYAKKILVSEPANEKAYQHIIFCLAALGDRTSALKQYDECEKKLRDELEIEPSQETLALRNHIEQELIGSKSSEAFLTNLPNPLTNFIGREKEITQVKQLLADQRLLTLIGSGGCGKTRLAIEVANKLIENFQDGVWWVDLAPLSDATLIPQSVAQSLGLHETPHQSLDETLLNFLRGKQLLLIFDNCEHLITACAQFVDKLLSTCSSLHILATSREALGIMGEMTWRVPSLALPDAEIMLPTEQLAQYDAVHLFAERAKTLIPNWNLQTCALAVTHICRRLDGIPLAIELAAARLKVLSVDQIAMRLDDRFGLLTSGSRTALPRQRTLRATIDWSYDLLLDVERKLLQRLSVFVGGWTLEAAESVCAGKGTEPPDVLDLLTRLVDRSLVTAETKESTIRYRLLETIREYAFEKLTESGKMTLVQKCHLDYFLKLSEDAYHRWHGREQSNWLNQLEAEHGNLRCAIEWSCENAPELGLRLTSALWRFWVTRGYISEGREQLALIMSKTGSQIPAPVRANALSAAGNMAYYQGDYISARKFLEENLEMRLEMEDDYGIGTALRELGMVTQSQGDYITARSLYEKSLVHCAKADDQWGSMASLSDLGQVSWNQGDYFLAQSCFQQALRIGQALGDKAGVAYSLTNLGLIAWSEGNYNKMRTLNEESLILYQELNDKWGIAHVLHSLGVVALAEGNYSMSRLYTEKSLNLFVDYGDKWGIAYALQSVAKLAVEGWQIKSSLSQDAVLASQSSVLVRAAWLFGAAEALCKKVDAHIEPEVLAHVEPFIAVLKNQLGEGEFSAAWQEGSAMPVDQYLAIAFEHLHE